MYTNLNPRTMGLNHHPYEDLLAAAGKCGFGGIEVPAHAFGSVEKAREAGKVLESRGMKWGLMMGPCDMFRAGDEEFDKALEQWAFCIVYFQCVCIQVKIYPFLLPTIHILIPQKPCKQVFFC